MTLGLIQQSECGAKFHSSLQDLTHHLALWRCRWLSFAFSNCCSTLWAVGARTMTRARDVHATWLAFAIFRMNPERTPPTAAKVRQTQDYQPVEYYQPVATALVTGRKACPAGHGERLHVRLRCLRAAEAAAHGVWDSLSLPRLTHQLTLWRPRWLSFTCS